MGTPLAPASIGLRVFNRHLSHLLIASAPERTRIEILRHSARCAASAINHPSVSTERAANARCCRTHSAFASVDARCEYSHLIHFLELRSATWALCRVVPEALGR